MEKRGCGQFEREGKEQLNGWAVEERVQEGVIERNVG